MRLRFQEKYFDKGHNDESKEIHFCIITKKKLIK